jgi:hypothetical protein
MLGVALFPEPAGKGKVYLYLDQWFSKTKSTVLTIDWQFSKDPRIGSDH